MAAASPGSYHTSTPSYYSTVRGGPTTPGSTSASSTAMTAATSAIPPPPLGGGPMSQYEDHNTNTNNNNSTLNSTPYLQSRLHQLRTQSSDLSSELTKKLATSRSGQSLLHIGPSLSTLPPDLSSLLEALSPLLKEVQVYESENRVELERLVTQGRVVQCTVRKRQFALECAEIYRDLCRAEEVLGKDAGWRMAEVIGGSKKKEKKRHDSMGEEEFDLSDDEDEDDEDEELDHATSLERAAYTTLHLLQELQSSSAEVSAITMGTSSSNTPKRNANSNEEDDDALNNTSNILPSLDDTSSMTSGVNGVIMEKSRFLMKLAPRIRRLESDTAKCLVGRLESLLIKVRHLMEDDESNTNRNDGQMGRENSNNKQQQHSQLLLQIASILRSLSILSRQSDAESSFARIAIMPIIRSKLSMGKLDEGGSRGECAGLYLVLEDIARSVGEMYGEVLRFGEGMFSYDNDATLEDTEGEESGKVVAARPMEVDLVTCGVWVPIATALMADPGIKMAIFSPGIANVLQANYSALDTFLSELAGNLLTPPPSSTVGDTAMEEEKMSEELGDFSHLYYKPHITPQSIARAQSRLYSHPTTIDYYKRWNLPIYYQLRFAEFTKRLDTAIQCVQNEGWHSEKAYTGSELSAKKIRESLGFELPFFVELYDILLGMWSANVYLRPLTHRFLRGSVQLVGKILDFVRGGLEGEIEFGGSTASGIGGSGSGSGIGVKGENREEGERIVDIPTYKWNERPEDIAVVSWELTILSTCMSHDYLESIANTACPADTASARSTHNSTTELDEIKLLASEILIECSHNIPPLVSHSWNELIVNNLTSQCCAPLAAVKGVAATYRMTNRPPPTQASPFVVTILRPLQQFNTTYASRTPPQIGNEWKHQVIESVSTKYSLAVEELIATVKRTEEALKSRKTRKMMAGGMSDGEKVKLQLFLDHKEFKKAVDELLDNVEGDAAEDGSTSIGGLVKLGKLTEEAESLFLRT